jgi:hypothetical protein
MIWRIYELRHPQTGRPVYVGCTRVPLEERLRAHCNMHASGAALVPTWIRRQRQMPTIALVGIARTKEAGERKELAHVRRLTRAGFALLNRKGNPLTEPWQWHAGNTRLGYLSHPTPCSICDRAKLDTIARVG